MDTGELVELGYLVGFNIESNGCPSGRVRVSGINYALQQISGEFDERFVTDGKLQVIITGGKVSDGACVRIGGGQFRGYDTEIEGERTYAESLSVRSVNLESHGLVPIGSITPFAEGLLIP